MDLKDITPGMLLVDKMGKLAVVTEVDRGRPRNPVVYKTSAGAATTYIAPPGFFRCSVGTVDLEKFKSSVSMPDGGTHNAGLPAEDLPGPLRGLVSGDAIGVRSPGGAIRQAKFTGWNPSAKKYPVNISMDGRRYRCPLSCVVRQGGRRPEKEIMSEIASVYANLSPENLTCDGELSVREVCRKRARLEGELEVLFSELGRRVTDSEAYAAEHLERA